MMDSTDMSTPVTRGELQEVLSQVKQEHWRDLREATQPLATKAELHQEIQAAVAPLATKVELHQEIQAAIAPLATKAELELWGGALVARIQDGERRLGNLELGQDRLVSRIDQLEQRVFAELARHTSAILEAMRAEIKACFEPLADLPARMTRVEAAVFGPGPGVRRTRRTRRRSN
jgi:hypothetical protein